MKVKTLLHRDYECRITKISDYHETLITKNDSENTINLAIYLIGFDEYCDIFAIYNNYRNIWYMC